MAIVSVPEALYRLGQIGRPGLTNADTLRGIARVAADATGADIIGLGVFENGVEGQSVAACVLGPWDEDLSVRFKQQTEWASDDRVLASRLSKSPADRLYHRRELIDEGEFQRTKLFNEFQRPIGMGDQALGVFRRADGLDLLICASLVDHRGALPASMLEAARALAPFMARAWASNWKREPAWMTQLRHPTKLVLDHLLAGYDDGQIASLTGLTYHSVRAHLKRLFRQAGVRSRLHLMQVCRGEITLAAAGAAARSGAA